mmetsp:Transcript_1178/g.3540  ORF Transcript_1178/g.3540 Transcript_1178/m.3540 type:complete len:452 (+) Transcript_1178:225-1580(+)|eukprot:CAMPEP_0119272506 /NCGR_PEP_ID=MMETSP1329-20130426/8641_1 /TAXON_ID=114041 /ORGANISM="Genus nov. species nov., Strain RCC1024" /LENGTH=451 /DNA_ID=CAMNT_0007272573 /DNA_START=208 /DNA_END=1563 /DNA_ORIENTATION=+
MPVIRVRTKAGTWRVEVGGGGTTIGAVKGLIEAQKAVPAAQQVISSDPGGATLLADDISLADAGLGANGAMCYLQVDAQALPPPPAVDTGVKGAARVKIGPNGQIMATEYDDYCSAKGFRPGQAALGDIKKSWTLTDFLEMDEQFNFKMKRQEKAECAAVSLDGAACNAFQQYVQQLGWRQQRVGFLYGTFEDGDGSEDSKPSVRVEAIYEPPQDCSERGFELLEDEREGDVAALAALLGLRRVGWIVACPPREKDFILSGDEVITAGLEQLEAAEGVHKTPFVTVRVSVNEKGEAQFEAYQASLQCMAMVAEGALAADPGDASKCLVHETFTAIVEGKRAPDVANEFFLCNVPVKQHASATLATKFPKEHRMIPQTRDDLKELLGKARSSTGNLVDALADFGLLLFLMSFPQIFDHGGFMPAVCACVTNREVPLDEGYGLILYSFAGMDF